MLCRVLGPLEVSLGSGEPLDLGGRKQRAVLGLLIVAGGRVVSSARLIEELWGESASDRAMTSIHSYVANLRRVLEPARPSRSPPTVLVSRTPGYALALPPGALDAATFETLVGSARDLLSGDPRAAKDRLDRAWALWRGEPFADIADAAPALAAEASRLEQLRLTAAEDRLRATMACGDYPGVVTEAEPLLADHPLLEQVWALLAVALYRSQRQGDALAVIRRARAALADQLGVDPGPELRNLEKAILDHDPSLQDGRTGVPAHRGWVVSAATQPPPPSPASDVLVGRDEALARLTGSLVDATAGRGRLAIVSGEPGIGKTELCRALASTAQAMGLRTGWGRCDEARGAPPLWPWTQALAELLADVNLSARRQDALAPAAAVLPALATASDRADAEPHPYGEAETAFRLSGAVATLLREAAGPSLLVLDDAHWADADTLNLLRRLGPHLDTLPTLVVITCRQADTDLTQAFIDLLGDLARQDPVREVLAGLAVDDVATYVSARQGTKISVAAARALHERTDGNPFYLSELVRMLGSDSRLHDPSAVASLDVPDGVRDVIRRRITHLDPAVEELLAAGSLVGRSFDLNIVQATCGLDADATAAALDTALAARLLDEERPGRYRFTHVLIQEVVRRRIPGSRRLDLHARTADTIERLWAHHLDDRLAQLAHHHANAGPQHAHKTWTYAARAARLAAAQPAPAEAVRLYEVAAEAVDHDPAATATERYRLLTQLIVARKRAGQEAAAWRAVHEAAALALHHGDAVAAAEVAVAVTSDSIWSWRDYQVVDDTAIDLLERLLHELPPGQPDLQARLLATLATELYYRPAESRRSQSLSEHAVDIGRTASGPDTLARVLELRHVVLERPALLPERLTTAEELAELAARSGDEVALARALVFRGKDHLEAGDISSGLADYSHARRLADKHAVAPILLALSYADALLLVARGQFDDAEAAAAHAAAVHDNTSLPGGRELPVVATTVLNLVRGTLHSIEPLLAAARAEDPSGVFTELHALALLDAGEAPEAVRLLGPLQELPEIPGDLLWSTRMAIRAQLCSRLAPQEINRDLYDQMLPYADRTAIAGTGIVILGSLSHPLGLLARAMGDHDTSVEHLADALRSHQASGFTALAVRSAHELAGSLRSRGESDDDRATSATYEAWARALASDLAMWLR